MWSLIDNFKILMSVKLAALTVMLMLNASILMEVTNVCARMVIEVMEKRIV